MFKTFSKSNYDKHDNDQSLANRLTNIIFARILTMQRSKCLYEDTAVSRPIFSTSKFSQSKLTVFLVSKLLIK